MKIERVFSKILFKTDSNAISEDDNNGIIINNAGTATTTPVKIEEKFFTFLFFKLFFALLNGEKTFESVFANGLRNAL